MWIKTKEKSKKVFQQVLISNNQKSYNILIFLSVFQIKFTEQSYEELLQKRPEAEIQPTDFIKFVWV